MGSKKPLTAAEHLRLQQLLQAFRSKYHFDLLYRINYLQDPQVITFVPGTADYEFLNNQIELLAGNYIAQDLKATFGDDEGETIGKVNGANGG